jgi:hypothetical protein
MSWILPGAAPAAVPASATEEAGEIEGSGLMMAQS